MPKKEVKSTYPQLKGAFKAHGVMAGNGVSNSENLLRFYAVECGLKALYIKKHKLKDTSEFSTRIGVKYGFGHDLMRWADEMKISGLGSSYKDAEDDPLKNAHEKYRYGVNSNKHDEILKALFSKLKKQLR